MKAIFKRHTPGKEEFEIIGILELVDGNLEWTKEPDENTLNLINDGIMAETPNGLTLIKPEDDPELFLESLPNNFRNTYFNVILEKEDNVHKSFNFSMQDQAASGELGNQVGYPIKVDGPKEQKSKTPQQVNGEPYFEKAILKSIVNDWFYNLIEGNTKTTALADLKLSMLERFSKSGYELTDQAHESFKALANIITKSESLFQTKVELDKWLGKEHIENPK
jgi:hypothetical protein